MRLEITRLLRNPLFIKTIEDMKKYVILLYGVISYLLFLAVFNYFVAFMGNVWVPKSIDSDPTMPWVPALLIDLALVLLFSVQHIVMARPNFKKWIKKFIPEAAERSTYVLASNLCLAVLIYFWQPLGGTIWQVEADWGRYLLYGLYFLGFGTVLLSTFLIDHFGLFGLKQILNPFRSKPFSEPHFQTPAMYKYTRHPMMLGMMVMMWSTPDMTITHLAGALMLTVFIAVSVRYEERDLVGVFGDKYQRYQQRVPKFFPRLYPKKTDLDLSLPEYFDPLAAQQRSKD